MKSAKTELVYCPGCHKFRQVQRARQGYLCLVCRLVFSKADSRAALEEMNSGVTKEGP